jgi:hypothetical protein
MIRTRQERRQCLRVQQFQDAVPGPHKFSPNRGSIEGQTYEFAGPDPSVVLVHRATPTARPGRLVIQRLQGAELAVTAVQNPLTSLATTWRTPAASCAPRNAGDPGWSFIRRQRHQRSRDQPAHCGPGLHRRSPRDGPAGTRQNRLICAPTWTGPHSLVLQRHSVCPLDGHLRSFGLAFRLLPSLLGGRVRRCG